MLFKQIELHYGFRITAKPPKPNALRYTKPQRKPDGKLHSKVIK